MIGRGQEVLFFFFPVHDLFLYRVVSNTCVFGLKHVIELDFVHCFVCVIL